MNKVITAVLILILGIAGYVYRYEPQTWESWRNRLAGIVQNRLENSELLPGPLRTALDAANAHLTVAGVIAATNEQREAHGLLPLKMNARLNQAAQAKVQDMFALQYFEHISPTGDGPSDLAKQANYKYIVVGENLALGNFKDDATLVEAWMNSPGHRENILNARYQEIGVAVGQGMFEGKRVWLAVQEFGTPISACPQPSTEFKTRINNNQEEIDRLEIQLNAQRAEMERARQSGSRDEYNQEVRQYNTLVNQINQIIDETKALVAQYNEQINQFNECLERNS
jgi:uncharacterized protein YukE